MAYSQRNLWDPRDDKKSETKEKPHSCQKNSLRIEIWTIFVLGKVGDTSQRDLWGAGQSTTRNSAEAKKLPKEYHPKTDLDAFWSRQGGGTSQRDLWGHFQTDSASSEQTLPSGQRHHQAHTCPKITRCTAKY